jgi:fumarate hydratase class II
MTQQFREEKDSIGSIQVDVDALWGAQTQRSLQNFKISQEKFPPAFIHAYVELKKAAAQSNLDLGTMEQKIANLIIDACDDILTGAHDHQFPLSIWQTGSGTQTNMNVNEVIANLANEKAGEARGTKTPVHPNDHVNCSQSSNDSFPTAMHIAAAKSVFETLLPEMNRFKMALRKKATAFESIVKIGRTHLQDAVPLTLGDVFLSFYQLIDDHIQDIHQTCDKVFELAIGGTAVGTGLNSPPGFDEQVTQHLSNQTSLPFAVTKNKFSALSAHMPLCALAGCLSNLAATLHKIAHDIRMLGSGPRCGLGELILPANEPGSSIMPGKVNPTQSEALTMVCFQVQGLSAAITQGATHGHFELNVYKPLIIFNILNSIRLLSDAMASFNQNCLLGIEANTTRIDAYLHHSLMLVTALNPIIGYDQSAKIAKHAYENHISLKEAAMSLNILDEATFDQAINPLKMAKPHPEIDD